MKHPFLVLAPFVGFILSIMHTTKPIHAENEGFNSLKMDSFFSLLDHTNKMMGQISIMENGKTIYERTIGYANIGKNIKANDSSLYLIGSVTKTFTATMILQLIDENKLSFDTRLSFFYPKMPNANKITIRFLLNHTSGLSDKYPIHLVKDIHKDTLTYTSDQIPDFVPGKKFIYCNINYGMLGLIIEKLTNSNFEDQLQLRICKKIGLRNTWFAKRPADSTRLTLAYYKKIGTWHEDVIGNRLDAYSAGGIVSNTSDMNSFLLNLSGGKLITESSFSQLMGSLNMGYGYGIMYLQFYQKTGYGHSGDIGAFHSNMVIFPEDNLIISICINGMDYSLNDILKGVLSFYYHMD